jgi:hypothetical protein
LLLQSRPVCRCFELPLSLSTFDPLLHQEVLYGVNRGTKEAAICSGFGVEKEPADGLEPSTASLP